MPEPITDEDMTSGLPSGNTEQGTPGRRKTTLLLAGVGTLLAVIVIAVAIVFASSDSTDNAPVATPSAETVTPTQPPASTLERSPQSGQLGSDN